MAAIAGAAFILIIYFTLFNGGGGDDDGNAFLALATASAAATNTAVATVPPTATVVPILAMNPTPTPSPTPAPTPTPDLLAGGCWTSNQVLPTVAASGAGTSHPQWSLPPARVIDTSNGYSATIETDRGTMEIELHAQDAPAAVNNFVCLARADFFEGMPISRLNPTTLLGGFADVGDSGPGYRFADEPVVGEYRRGTLAMVSTGPDTNGSEFFIFVNDPGTLPKRYTIFGNVTAGLMTANMFADNRGNSVIIEQVTITETALP